MNVAGSVSLVTGGASGLGRATTEMLLKDGGKVAVIDRNSELLDALKDDADEAQLISVVGDVTSEADVGDVLSAVERRWGSLHCVINAAGIGAPQRTLGRNGPIPLANFEAVVDVNLIGTFNVLRLSAALMSKHEPVNDDGERGVIINTASVAAFEGQVGQASYSASKGGIVAMTLPIARDLARVGVRCVTIAPGILQTPILGGLSDDALDSIQSDILFPRRLGKASEYASLVRFLIECSYINGETIRLDAGARLSSS